MYENRTAKRLFRYAHGASRRLISAKWSDYIFQKNSSLFSFKSRNAERILRSKGEVDAVFQIFTLFRTYSESPRLPVFMLLDYTMMLADRNWPDWAPFPSQDAKLKWFELERQSYASATHLFAMSQSVADSLINDYGVEKKNITVVGSAPNISHRPETEKSFGSKAILFNGSDFHRKGGDIAVEAIRILREKVPDAKLRVIGNRFKVDGPGVESIGPISDQSTLANLFSTSDLVVAPGRCDPFPTFLVEAHQYGVPVIASDRDGMPEIVLDEVTGLIMKSLTADELARHAEKLLSSPETLRVMSSAAQARATDRFNWPTLSTKVRAVIEDNLS
jgi:glycosyltransferase involved in cell wall biosynthesis